MNGWWPIASAPRDGSMILCWSAEWDSPSLLVWKTNQRVVKAHAYGASTDIPASYFGDPVEDDEAIDYGVESPATHWFPYPSPPRALILAANAVDATTDG